MLRTEERTGADYLSDITSLLQRARREDRMAGPWEAADHQWWWRSQRRSDEVPMPFWYDDDGPVAAAVTTDWGSATWLDLAVVPSLRAELLPVVFERGMTMPVHDDTALEILVGDDDEPLIDLLRTAGFEAEPVDATGWLDTADVRDVTALAEPYRLVSRADVSESTHPFAAMTPETERRLNQTSLYRSDLDLTILGDDGAGVAHALFWHDPTTRVGLVEPVRTEEEHQGRGLARHLVTAGVQRLVEAGSEYVKISWDLENEPAAAVYTGSGFVPLTTSSIWTRPGD